MKWYYDLKIGIRLFLGFTAVVLIAGIIGVYSIVNMNIISGNSTVMYDNMTVPMEELAQISITFQKQRVLTRDIVIYTNLKDKQFRADKIKEYDETIEELINKYEKSIVEVEGFKLFNSYKTALQKYIPIRDQIIKLALEEKNQEAIEAIKD